MVERRWIPLEELAGNQAEWRRLAAESEFPTALSDPAWVLAWWERPPAATTSPG